MQSKQTSFVDRLVNWLRVYEPEVGPEIWIIDEAAEAEIRRALAQTTSAASLEAALWDLVALAEVCAMSSPDAARTLQSLAREGADRLHIRQSTASGLEARAARRPRFRGPMKSVSASGMSSFVALGPNREISRRR